MPTREHPWTRPPGPGPWTRPPGGHTSGAHRPLRQPRPAAHQDRRPRKIAFADELPSRARPDAQRPPRASPAPDYELKYPPVRCERGRRCYAAVFRDQYWELLELQKEVESTQAKLGQLEALLRTLPPARNQKEAHMAAYIWRALEKKWMDPAFLDKQARCRYLKGKLRHLKTQIQKFDDQEDSKGSVYF
ncbi:occludin/ELL domain-containing protein 1 [Perognathus longimembris pacificus]|uniref:occludin/ELL domain-containing protein 1 n=1 Tax=Perognathus longimembris pacificus TaxID=214514 RepID=UPI00201A001C|nr:occludin/ELL domain-containing protein 1 [Perognathus longimembris pacificus]